MAHEMCRENAELILLLPKPQTKCRWSCNVNHSVAPRQIVQWENEVADKA